MFKMEVRMSGSLDFYYDIASPYSYLAAHRVAKISDAGSVDVRWKPILLGGIFRATENTMPAAVPARGRYMLKDLARWAERIGVPFHFSSTFPHHSLVAMRALTAAPTALLPELSLALFRATWVENKDLSQVDVVTAALGTHGPDLVTATQDPTVKAKLMSVTQEAIDAGAFGAPSFVVDGELFWGNDRLEMALDVAQRKSEGA